MIAIEIENTETGALLRIPDCFFYIEETFENSVEDVSWEQWTRPVEVTLDELDHETFDDHFLYGAYEMLCQSENWARPVESVMKKGRREFTNQSDVVIRTLRS